jgi:hypothetical protein
MFLNEIKEFQSIESNKLFINIMYNIELYLLVFTSLILITHIEKLPNNIHCVCTF